MTRTSTGNSVGMEGRASGPECAQNSYSERETGGLCEAECLIIDQLPFATAMRVYRALDAHPRQAAELERLRGALREIEALPNMSRDPVEDFDRGARAARLDAADIAARALSPNTSEQSA